MSLPTCSPTLHLMQSPAASSTPAARVSDISSQPVPPHSLPHAKRMRARMCAKVCQAALGFWPVVGIAAFSMTVGIIAALAVVRTLRRSVDPVLIARENAVLREKVAA
eukprot:365948-Chlamydomonas_euryale.AAC.18